MTELTELPDNLPVPKDDGAANHLLGMAMPDVSLPSTSGLMVNVSKLPTLYAVLYFYPMTGVPGVALPNGWDDVPGARGCTPQAMGFGKAYSTYRDLGVSVYGVSTQTPDYQREVVERLRLPFGMLSDEKFKLINALSLPTFNIGDRKFVRRLTIISKAGNIWKVFYPVFPPNLNARTVLAWLQKELSA